MCQKAFANCSQWFITSNQREFRRKRLAAASPVLSSGRLPAHPATQTKKDRDEEPAIGHLPVRQVRADLRFDQGVVDAQQAAYR
jgi:hypothetical protein